MPPPAAPSTHPSPEFDLETRIAGILVPIFALRGKGDLGVGDAESLIEFIDWAADNGFKLVKMLPINETGGDHSPYNALSSRALDPVTIRTTPQAMPDLSARDFEKALAAEAPEVDGERVRYAAVKPFKRRLLEAAFERFSRNHLRRDSARGQEFRAFEKTEESWLPEYTLFRTLVEEHGGQRWQEWPAEQRTAEAARSWLEALPPRARRALEKRRQLFAYVQWIAFTQWRKAKAHAAQRNVGLVGDIPFGISFQSADVWAHPELFRSGWCGGTPPDKIFKHDPFVQKWGQNWGIPLYDWEAHRQSGFRWWRGRVAGVREFFDLFRIDHVLGFYRIYGFPWAPERNAEFLPLSGDEAAERVGGQRPGFQPRPDDSQENKDENCRAGEEYLRAILEEAGKGRVIGEDLGEVPDYVRPSLARLGIAGYKVPQWEKRSDGSLIPGSDYDRLSLATYGTHDHDTIRVMWERLVRDAQLQDGDHARYELRILCDYAGLPVNDPPQAWTAEVHAALLRALLRSNSWIAVVMVTDLFGRSERFNSPGVANDENWTQRIHAPIAELSQEPILATFHSLLRESGRVGP